MVRLKTKQNGGKWSILTSVLTCDLIIYAVLTTGVTEGKKKKEKEKKRKKICQGAEMILLSLFKSEFVMLDKITVHYL